MLQTGIENQDPTIFDDIVDLGRKWLEFES